MWKEIWINESQIEVQGEKSVLIKMPEDSEYNGFKFWHPSKLVRCQERSNDSGTYTWYNGMYSFSYTGEFKFHLMKYGNSGYSKFQASEELDIEVETMERAFRDRED